MTTLKKRERAKTNASLISMVQRFSDITIMLGGLWVVCKAAALPFLYLHLLMALVTLVAKNVVEWRNARLLQAADLPVEYPGQAAAIKPALA